MAESVNGECPCGYSVQHLTHGAFMSGNSRWIHSCADCGALASLSAPVESCARCGGLMNEIFYQNNTEYPCPQCRKQTLRLYTALMAD